MTDVGPTSYEALKRAYDNALPETRREFLSYAAFKMSAGEWSKFVATAPMVAVPPDVASIC